MTTITLPRAIVEQALEALENTSPLGFNMESDKKFYAAIIALRAALAQQAEPKGGGNLPPPLQAEPVQEPQTLDAAMQQPRAMAQAYENGHRAGVAHEREACAKLAESTICDTHLPTGVRIYGTRVADAIRTRSNT